VLLIVGGGDDNSSQSSESSALQEKLLTHTVVDQDKGISVRRPENWTDAKQSGAILIQSPGRCLAIQLAAPAAANQFNSLHTDALKLIRQSSKRSVVRPATGQDVGGIPTRADAIDITDQKGRRADVLLYLGKGKKYTYVTKVAFGTASSCQADVAVGRLILDSVQYTK
jgi:hypothetical protein